MDDKVIPFNKDKKRTKLTIEQTILAGAVAAFEQLETICEIDSVEFERNDVFAAFSGLTGITTLIEVEKHGLSKNLVSELKVIDTKALYLMRKMSGIKID